MAAAHDTNEMDRIEQIEQIDRRPSGEAEAEADAGTVTSYANRAITSLHDPNVQFEEYLYYATISRSEEQRLYGANTTSNQARRRSRRFLPFGGDEKTRAVETATRPSSNETPEKSQSEKTVVEVKAGTEGSSSSTTLPVVTDQEWVQASRAARTATWGAVFYLITTDILGPFSVPWAMSQLGYGPGIALFTVFGALAGYTGYQIWQMFLGLDSDRYPLKNYGDIAYRIFGQWARYTCNVLQSLQFFLNVAILIISNGQAISQLSKGTLCFIVCLVIFVVAGFSLGQIRTLAKFGYVANLAVWMNLLVIFLTMGVVAHSSPNYKAVAASYPNVLPDPDHPGPIVHTLGTPANLSFTNNINGLMQAVFSYGGATLFCEFMAEMRRPRDFWKGLICAEAVIYTAYMIFGLFVYAYQGQYAFNPANQGITPYNFQTAGNVLGLISALIAACMYGNIGIKVLYANVGRELLHFPPLESRGGKMIWIGLVPLYWILAFVVGSAIPQISNFSSLVGAACILQFTYTFPPILMLGFKAQRDSILPEETFDPQTGLVTRVDSGMARWMRGLRRDLLINAWDAFFAIGAAATATLGIYASVVLLIQGYQDNPSQAAFSCKSPSG
ncbi:MAG: hypothetical protein M1838_006132 [Thelocarpon superellum]|nr:MAG: hypothetical protein M1838_006132 [Thelocarpon superellum]